MALSIVVTANENEKTPVLLPDGRQVYETLGGEDRAEAVSVRIQELLDRIFTELREAVDVECNAEVQVSGKVTLTGKGDAKFLIFNVGGSAATETAMSIKLSAKLSPRERPAKGSKGSK